MKTLIKLIPMIFLIFSCSNNKESQKETLSIISDEIKTEIPTKSIFPDFIALTETDFHKFEKGNNSKWFKFRNQKLYFIPYTDYSITGLILTNERLKNEELIELLKFDEIIVVDSINAISTSEFITDKKIKLNVSRDFVEKIYGKSDSIKTENGNETLFWNFVMDENRGHYKYGNLKPFVHNELGFSVEMTFKNDSLKTLIYNYQVP